DHVAVGLLVNVPLKVRGVDAVVGGEELDQLGAAGVAVQGAGGVELDTVAGAQHDQLGLGEAGGEGLGCPVGRRRIERQSLAQRQRRGGMVQAKQQQPLHYAPSGMNCTATI